MPSHQHEHEHIGFVLSGRFRFTISNKAEELVSGEAYSIPSGASHSVVAFEDGVVLDVFHPHREDYYLENEPPEFA